MSTYSYPGNIGGQAVPGCDSRLVADGMCLYDRYSRFEAQPAVDAVTTGPYLELQSP